MISTIKADFVAMGRVLLCVLLLAASVQLCVASTAEGALVVAELSDHVNAPVVTESAKKQAQSIVAQAKVQAAAIKAKADGVMEQADGMKQKIEEAQAEIQKQKRTLKVETKATKQALTQATQTAAQAQTDGAVAAKASQDAQVVQKRVVQKAAETKKEEKKTLGKLEATKVMAAAKAAEQMESATAQTIDASQAKADATTQMKEATAAKEALSAEIVKVNAAHQRNKDLENKLNDETKKEEAKSAEAQKAVGEVQLAKSKIKLAAKAAIKAAVDKAAAIAHSEQDKLIQQQAQEREKQGTMSAQSLAQEAKVAAQATLAQQEMAKAKQMMAAAKAKSGEKAPGSEKASSQEQGNVGESTTVWDDNVDTTNTLLEKMYKTIPYKAQCGALADDATNIESRAKMSFGACTVRCTAEFKCKSFEYDHAKGHCSISPRQLLTKTSAGAALACATKKVLVTSSMQLPSKPDVFTKRESASSAQEVQKEAKVDAKVDVQKAKARVKGQVTSLTQKGEELESQKIDAETKEKVEEANAVNQIHQADKLKTEIKQEATVKKAVVEDKKQSQQKLAASQREVHQLRKQLAESQTETESTKVSLNKLKAPETAPEKSAENAPEKAAEKAAENAPEKAPEEAAEKAPEEAAEKAPEEAAEKAAENAPEKAPEKAAPQLETKAERWQLEALESALMEVQAKIKKLKAKTSEISRGAVACQVMVPKLEARLKDEGASAEKAAEKEKKELEKLTAAFDGLDAEEKAANAQRQVMILKADEEKKMNIALEEQLHQLQGNELALSKDLKLAHDAANEHADKVAKYNAQSDDIRKVNSELSKKAKMKDVCEKVGADDIKKCKQQSATKCKNLEKRVNKKHEAYKLGGAAYRMCAAELNAAQGQAGEMREMIAKSETILTDHASKLEMSTAAMKESVLSELTPKITKQARDTCDKKLERAIAKVANKRPISRKCQVCAKLDPKIQVSLGVQCGDC